MYTDVTATEHSRSAAHDLIKQRPSLSQSKMPAVENSVADSLEVWAEDLRSLFDSARERFADIRWRSTGDTLSDAIWAHKGMTYLPPRTNADLNCQP